MQSSVLGMSNSNDKLVQAIAQTYSQKYVNALLQNEARIDWLAFFARLYRISHSTDTIINYAVSMSVFREFIAQSLPKQEVPKTICDIIDDAKADNEKAYKYLDDFVTWCDGAKQYKPRTTRMHFVNIKRLFAYVGVDLSKERLRDITMPRAQEIADEYPSNEIIRRILAASSLTSRGFLQVILDTGLEPTDCAQLQVKDIRFSEDPARIEIEREKTGHKIECFISAETVGTLKTIISTKDLKESDYLFCKSFKHYVTGQLRDRYNVALAKAGFGTVVRKGRTYKARVEKIEGHSFGKYHLKVYKKRWFTIVTGAGVPEYVAQAMLGRHAYLMQYYRQPLEKRQEFAKKILAAVSVYADKQNKQEILQKAGQLLGLENVTEEQAMHLRGVLQDLMTLPKSKYAEIFGS